MPSSVEGSSPLSMPQSLESYRRLPSATVDENLPIPQLDNPRTQDVFHSIVKGRKSWKTLRGGEIVWPPELEAALIEGLENYKPDDSRETRLLGRFPLRNRFISDWIYEKTGKRRTAKQVGSRLQQLRDTCGGKRLINLISPRRPIPPRASSSLSPKLSHHTPLTNGTTLDQESESCSDASSASSPTTPTEVHATLQNLLYRGIASPTEIPFHSIVYIDLLPGNPSSGLKVLPNVPVTSTLDNDELLWSERGMEIVRISPQPRYITDIDPTITFTCRSPKIGMSMFSLYADGELVHSESAELKCLGPLPDNEGHYLHKTSLLPSYWSRLTQVPNLSQYHIGHRVVEESSSSSNRSVLFSTIYKFRYPSSGPAYNIGSYGMTNQHDVGVDKETGLDYAAFDTLLSIPSSDGGYSTDSPVYEKPQNLYDMSSYMKPDWSGYPTSYQNSH